MCEVFIEGLTNGQHRVQRGQGFLRDEGDATSQQSAPWVLLTPVACIIVTVLACNLLGDGVRVALDPRLRQRVA